MWMRHGGQSAETVPYAALWRFDWKFDFHPGNLVESILDIAMAAAVHQINAHLPENQSVNIAGVDVADIHPDFAADVAQRLTGIGVPVNPNDPVIRDTYTMPQRYLVECTGGEDGGPFRFSITDRTQNFNGFDPKCYPPP